MGFTPERRVYRLAFADDDLAGLTVRAHSTSLGAFLDVTGLAGIDPSNMQPGDVGRLEDLFRTFADSLLDWNLEVPAGVPVPATFDGLKSQDADLVMRIIRAWMEGISNVPPASGPTSSDGERSDPPPLPMEPLRSLPS